MLWTALEILYTVVIWACFLFGAVAFMAFCYGVITGEWLKRRP